MRIWGLIFILQVFLPAKVIFAGIGVLLLVSIPLGSSVQAIEMTWSVRWPGMLMGAEIHLLTYSHTWRISSSI